MEHHVLDGLDGVRWCCCAGFHVIVYQPRRCLRLKDFRSQHHLSPARFVWHKVITAKTVEKRLPRCQLILQTLRSPPHLGLIFGIATGQIDPQPGAMYSCKLPWLP